MKYITLFSFLIVLSLPYSTKGMLKDVFFPDPLTQLEKLILFYKIQKIGKNVVLEMIEVTNDNSNRTDESKGLPTRTKIRKNRDDHFAISIINAIKAQEKKYGYIPAQISEKKDGVWHITIPTNYLGNYTRYWHKEDNKGAYIELYSAFMYKPALLEAISNY